MLTMKAITLRELRSAAQAVGAKVEDDSAGRWNVLQIIAPNGKQWKDGGCRSLKVEWPQGQSAQDAYRDAMNRIRVGLDVADPENMD